MNKRKNTPDNLRVLLSDSEPVCASEEHELKALAMTEGIIQVPAPLDVHLLGCGQVLHLSHQVHTLHLAKKEIGELV